MHPKVQLVTCLSICLGSRPLILIHDAVAQREKFHRQRCENILSGKSLKGGWHLAMLAKNMTKENMLFFEAGRAFQLGR